VLYLALQPPLAEVYLYDDLQVGHGQERVEHKEIRIDEWAGAPPA